MPRSQEGHPEQGPAGDQEFFQEFVASPEYQANPKERILAGKAPQIELLGLYWVGGKPTERHEVQTDTLDRLSALAAAHGLRD